MAMMYLIAGLVLFLGVHSTRIFANDWRNQTLARIGEKPFKGVYALLSLAGFVLLVWGYGQARQQGVMLWNPPTATRHIAALLMLLSFVLLAAWAAFAFWLHRVLIGVSPLGVMGSQG